MEFPLLVTASRRQEGEPLSSYIYRNLKFHWWCALGVRCMYISVFLFDGVCGRSLMVRSGRLLYAHFSLSLWWCLWSFIDCAEWAFVVNFSFSLWWCLWSFIDGAEWAFVVCLFQFSSYDTDFFVKVNHVKFPLQNVRISSRSSWKTQKKIFFPLKNSFAYVFKGLSTQREKFGHTLIQTRLGTKFYYSPH